MKWILICVLIITSGWLAIPNAALAADTGRIEWFAYDAGLARARETGRIVLVDFHADWCGYCKKMDAETFSNAKVIKLINERFVPVSVDTEKQKDIAAQYGVRSLPTIWFLESDSEAINQLPGFVPADMFIVILDYISSRAFETVEFKDFHQQKQSQ